MLAAASADASGRLDAGDAPFARATAAAPPDYADATANNASLDVAFRAMALSAATPGPRAHLTLTTEFAIRAGRAGADPRSAAPHGAPHDNFLKSCVWSPDGVSLLTCAAEDDVFRIYDVPVALDALLAAAASDDATGRADGDEGGGGDGDGDGGGGGDGDGASFDGGGDGDGASFASFGLPADALWPALRVAARESVYDYEWYPRATASAPETFLFASTSRASPVHLRDAVADGAIVASYVGMSHLDEPVAAKCVAFASDGASIYAGYDKGLVRAWDVARPGREPLLAFKADLAGTSRKRRKAGSKGGPEQLGDASSRDGAIARVGAVSCLSSSPAEAGSAPLLAVGGFGGGVALVDLRDGARASPAALLGDHATGVTGLAWSPDGNYLYTGARKDARILCWDVRGASDAAVYAMRRASAHSNQRVGFDVEPCGRHLVTGGEDGVLRAFDLRDGSEVGSWRAARDCVSDWAFHPAAAFAPAEGRPVARGASVSGERRFRSRLVDEEEEEEEEGAGVRDPRARSGCGTTPRRR